ncbi:uncharacterized protein LOC142576022 isoform X2 [Dermacentor variabilis]|uniref:uncharacterized protein LOC142576022 isoform X2 n=1 Tax=Dermacentor variabilis TaxID=34621 RepID=UPI003F5BD10D
MDSIPTFVPEGATKKSAPRVVSFAGQDIEKPMTPEATQDVMATAPMFATPTSDPAHLTSGELQHLRLLHDDALQGRTSSLTVALIIACISSIALALIKITIKRHDNISSAECVFFVGTGILVSVMPTQSDTLQPFGPASAQKRLGVSAVLTTLAYILGYMAVQFMSVVEATVVAAITPMTTWFTMVAVRRRPCHWVLVPVLASCVTAIVLVVKPPIFGFKVRREHTWVILLVRIVANIVCAMVLESAFVDPDLLDSVQVLAALMVVFAGALTTLHLLVEGQENSPVVAAHRFLQLFT